MYNTSTELQCKQHLSVKNDDNNDEEILLIIMIDHRTNHHVSALPEADKLARKIWPKVAGTL